MKAWEIQSPGGIDSLAITEHPTPKPGFGQVCVRIMASSINNRDLSTILNPQVRNVPWGRVPNSDAAGEVVSVGEGVSRFGVGDRVAGCFFGDWTSGPISSQIMSSALGGPQDGVLAEEVVFFESGLVMIPDYLSWQQAATLPCAALTAWRALVESGGVKAGDNVLLLGTGGVSLFALQFAKMHGARVILTSSSDEKLQKASALGADQVINYRKEPHWNEAVLEHTRGLGVDHVVEVGGSGTLAKSIDSTRVGGHIAFIGVLDTSELDITGLMRKSIRLQGMYVGSRSLFLEMNNALDFHKISPVIDRTFTFDQAPAAYQYMQQARHFGKIVISME